MENKERITTTTTTTTTPKLILSYLTELILNLFF